ncbi:MAG: type VI secretion system Vgr family protein [Bryobacteraceae bacterium]
MSTVLTQEDRILNIDTPLGPDVLILKSFTGTEFLSRLFHFDLDLVSEDPNIEYSRIIGENVTLGVRQADDETYRYINGHITRFTQLPSEGHLARYQAWLDPWPWFLTRTSDCRIFQNKSVPDIVDEVFHDFGYQQYELNLTQTYEPWEYCVQYRETAFNFISRLLEQEGIFFFFRHENRNHTLVLADHPSAHKPWPGQSPTRYEQLAGPGHFLDEEVVVEWRALQEVRSGKYATTDYNFETPSRSLLSAAPTTISDGDARLEIFEYPGEFDTLAESEQISVLRMEEEEVPHTLASGVGSCREFSAGSRFELVEHPRKDQNGKYVLTSVTHSGNNGEILGLEEAESSAEYSNTFTCIPIAVRFRPPRVTSKPIVQGPQTAVVVGPAGEEIYTDKYGRVKVQFHWDRYGKKDDKSSCWVRVSHPWAGKNWGAIAIPRIGQEVIVGFLEGDPDQPIITGRVYNAEQMPPFELPAGAVLSGVKSNSTKGGGGYNQFSMDDTKGKEMVTIHAQYDMGTTVEHDQTTTVHNNRTDKIDVDDSETVGNNQTVSIGAKQNISVGTDQTTSVGVNQTTSVGSNQTNSIGSNQTDTVGASRTTTISANDALNVGANETVIVGASRSTTISANDDLAINGARNVTVIGPVSIISNSSIALTVGSSNITITSSKVTITSPLIKLN